MSDNKENVPPTQLTSLAEKVELNNERREPPEFVKRPRKPATERQLETLKRGREIRLERKRETSASAASASASASVPAPAKESEKPEKVKDEAKMEDNAEQDEEDEDEESEEESDESEEEEPIRPMPTYRPRFEHKFNLSKVALKRQKNTYATRNLFG